MKRIISYMKPDRWYALSTAVIKFISTIVLLLIPYAVEHVVDNVVPRKDIWLLLFWGLVMILLAVVERWLNLLSSRMSVRVAKNSVLALRRDLFARAIGLSGAQVDEIGLPSLTSRLTGDVYNVQSFYQNLLTFAVRAPTLVLGSIALTLMMDSGLALILCIIAPVMVAAVALVSWKGIPLFGGVQKKTDAATRILRENITGVRVVKALAKEKHETARFAKANDALKRSECVAGDIMSLPGPLTTFFLNVGLVIIVLVGARRVDGGLTQPGVILAFLTFFNMILMGVIGLNRIFMIFSKASASIRRIAQVMEQPENLPVMEPETCDGSAGEKGYLVFDRVSFRYGEASDREEGMSLSNVSFAVKKGGSLGIIGPTGSGKTTIVNLLMRFYDPASGGVYVGGRDVRTYEKDELRRLFGTVFQNDMIFAESISENIAFGREVDEDGVKKAAAHAMAGDFVDELPEGFAHTVAARGADLSGGQRQRLLIARALAAHPEVLVFDDSSSALDYRTDAALRAALREHYGDTTTVTVAQRVSSIMDCDEILVLDEGRVIGRGTHDELLGSCPQYLDIYKTQMGEGV